MTRAFIFLVTLLVMTFASNSFANGPWDVRFQNLKLPSQALMEHYTWSAPALGSTTLLLSASNANNGSATTFSSFLAQPDFPRNIVITPGGSTSKVGAGTAVVSGTNIYGKSISENFTISSTQNSATTGAKAFASVSSVSFPATTGGNVNVNVGVGSKLGLIRCVNNAGDYVFSELNGVYDATRGTLAVSSSAVESNTFSPNGAMDGAKNVDLFYVQNFRCYGN